MHSALCVCLSVAVLLKQLWTALDEIRRYGKVAQHPGTIPLNFGGDPDSRSGFWIRNMNFLKYVIAR